MRFNLLSLGFIAALSAPIFVVADGCVSRRDHARDISARDDTCPFPDDTGATEAPFPGDTGECDGIHFQLCCFGQLGPIIAGFYSYVQGCQFGGLGMCIPPQSIIGKRLRLEQFWWTLVIIRLKNCDRW